MEEVPCQVRLNTDLTLDLIYVCPVCHQDEALLVDLRELLAFEPALAFNNYCHTRPVSPWYLIRVPGKLVNKLKGWARAASLSWAKQYPLEEGRP